MAQPPSREILGGKNDLFSPSLNHSLGQKCHFCPPQAHVNYVVPQQNVHKCCIVHCLSVESFYGAQASNTDKVVIQSEILSGLRLSCTLYEKKVEEGQFDNFHAKKI